MKYLLLISVVVIFIGCKSLENKNSKIISSHSSKYELVKEWPQLPKTFPFSHVTAIDIDRNQNVFMLQRTGRVWTNVMPDTVITSNTVFLLEKETGRVLKSWGANLFIMPHGITVDNENNVWVVDVGLHQVFKFNHDGLLILKLGVEKVPGSDSAHFNRPTDVAIARDGSFYVSDGYRNSRIIKFSKDGKYLFEWGKKGTGQSEFHIPHAISINEQGNVLVADRENNRIQVFDSVGKFLMEWKNNQAQLLMSLCIDKMGKVYALDDMYVKGGTTNGDDIILFDSKLNLITRFGRSDSTADTTALFHDIAVDNEGTIYVANILGQKVQKFKAASVKK